jgi:hypothetical protein
MWIAGFKNYKCPWNPKFNWPVFSGGRSSGWFEACVSFERWTFNIKIAGCVYVSNGNRV